MNTNIFFNANVNSINVHSNFLTKIDSQVEKIKGIRFYVIGSFNFSTIQYIHSEMPCSIEILPQDSNKKIIENAIYKINLCMLNCFLKCDFFTKLHINDCQENYFSHQINVSSMIFTIDLNKNESKQYIHSSQIIDTLVGNYFMKSELSHSHTSVKNFEI